MLNASTSCEHWADNAMNKIFILEIRIFETPLGNGVGLLILDKQTNEPVDCELFTQKSLLWHSTKHSKSCSKLNWFSLFSDGQSEVEVDLIAKKYVERGSSVTLYCKHNVEPATLYKVTWLKNGNKVFEYINGRDPPYRNFSVAGGEIDVMNEGLLTRNPIL